MEKKYAVKFGILKGYTYGEGWVHADSITEAEDIFKSRYGDGDISVIDLVILEESESD